MKTDIFPKGGRIRLLILLLGAFGLVLGGSVASYHDSTGVMSSSSQDDPIERGRQSFRLYCASCHGETAEGDGPVAEVLNPRPANLTLLRASNDGIFPAETIYEIIDGRDQVRAHGTRAMPVWGNIWEEADGEPVDPDVVDMRIRELVEFLRSIQEAGDS